MGRREAPPLFDIKDPNLRPSGETTPRLHPQVSVPLLLKPNPPLQRVPGLQSDSGPQALSQGQIVSGCSSYPRGTLPFIHRKWRWLQRNSPQAALVRFLGTLATNPTAIGGTEQWGMGGRGASAEGRPGPPASRTFPHHFHPVCPPGVSDMTPLLDLHA